MIAFIGGTGYVPGKAELWCDGEKLVTFDMCKACDMKWKECEVELQFIFGGDTRDEHTTFGISGLYLLKLPASKIKVGSPLNLSVRLQPGQGDWFMVHCYHNIFDCMGSAVTPDPPCQLSKHSLHT